MSVYPDSIRRSDNEEFGEQVISKAVKAGRRTYFFDIRATRGKDYFLTITESRKKTLEDGTVAFDRHKIFLYKEDFAKFANSLLEVIDYIRQEMPDFFENDNTSAASFDTDRTRNR